MCPQLKRSRRGQATAIGAVFFFLIVSLSLSFLYETIQVQGQMRDLDTQKAYEQLVISGVLFGASSAYTTPSYTVTTGTGTPSTGVTSASTSATTYPISNMNFTESSSGWSFTTSYTDTTTGAIGAFDGTDGSTSGVGSVFADFSIGGSGTYAANMTWSTRFYWDPAEYGTISEIRFSYSRKTVQTSSKTQGASLKVKLVNPNGAFYRLATENIGGTQPDVSWSINYGINVPTNPNPLSVKGFYTLQVETWAEIKPGGSVRSEFKEYYDDIGLRVTWSGYVSDWYASFTLNEAPGTISRLDLTYKGHYDKTVLQNLYIYSFPRGTWVLLSSSSVSTSSVTTEKQLTTSDVQDYISSAKQVRIRVYASETSSFVCTADSIKIVDYYSSNTGVSVNLTNYGSVTVNVVSFWINGPTGHTKFEPNLYISPGETKTVAFTYTWSTGQYTLKAITSRGTIAILVTTAA